MRFTKRQTILFPDGTLSVGKYPTLDWLALLQKILPMNGKTILEVGSNEGMCGVYFLIEGATRVLAYEENDSMAKRSKWLATQYLVGDKWTRLKGEIKSMSIPDVDVAVIHIAEKLFLEDLDHILSKVNGEAVFFLKNPLKKLIIPTSFDLQQRYKDFDFFFSKTLLRNDKEKVELLIFRRK